MEQTPKLDLEKLLGHFRESLGEEQFAALARGEAADLDGERLESLLDIALGTSPPPAERELSKRAALTRTFDRELYEEVLTRDLPGGEDAPAFEAFANHPDLSAVPRQPGLYRLREEARERHLAAWTDDEGTKPGRPPEALLQFCARLLEHFASKGEEESIETLPLRMLLDPEDGRGLFESLYREADRRFDLARCQSLLATATAWTGRFQAHLARAFTLLLGERRQYYEARTLFLAEYHQTAPYYLRKEVKAWLGRLRGEGEGGSAAKEETGSPWIFHLHATGGMGKTMLLHWLIARESIPEPLRTPCARVDFDHLDLAMAARYPWLLLLPLARQLNRQVPATPFLELLREHGWLESALQRVSPRQEEGRRQDAEAALESRGVALAEQVLAHTGSGLGEIPPGEPVLIILDTLEEATLYYPEGLLATLRLFGSLRAGCAGLRLILSGRYDIWKRLPALDEELGSQVDVFELQNFSEEEASDYLRERRHVPESAPLDAIVKKAKGIPFKLALFAELALTRPDLTAKEVQGYPSTDFAYLIDRVIERLPEQALRWVIRYGVVPRDLTFDFLEQVIAPHLPEEGPSENDRPGESWPETARSFAARKIWKPSLGEIDLRALWDLLGDYASSRGWISFTDPERSALRFKPEVVDPMRHLLQPEPVFALLQESAISYYEERAERESGSWARFSAEALFHRFQLEGAAAAEHFHRLLAEPRARRDPAARKLFSETVLDRGLAREQREPRLRRDDSEMVDKKTLLEAHLEAASAALAMAPLYEREHTLWHEARRHMKLAEELRGEVPEAAPPSRGRRQLLAAADAMNRRDLPAAARHLGRALRAAGNDRQRFSLRLQLAHVLALQDDRRAEKHYRAAIDLARRSSATHLPLYQVRRLLGQLLAEHGDYERAEEELRGALAAGRREGDQEESARIARRLAGLYLETHRFRDAADLLRELPDGDFATARLEIELELALSRPGRALALVAELRADEPNEEQGAWLDELSGKAKAQVLAFRDALELLESAKNRWADLGSDEGVARCRLSRLAVVLLDVGDLGEARFLLEASERSTLQAGSALWLRRRQLALVLHARRGDTEGAREIWREALGSESVARRPRQKAYLLATGLALGLAEAEADRDPALELAKALRRVRPEPARWAALEPLELAREPIEGLKRRRGKLLSLLPVPERLDLYRLPEAQILACLLRSLPQEGKGQKLLERGERFCEKERLAVPMRCFLALRASWPEARRSRPPRLERIREDVAGEPQLEGALLLAASRTTTEAELSRRLLAEARDLFAADALPSRLLAQLHAALGRLAPDPEEAAEHLGEAALIYEQLEDPAAAEGLRREVEAIVAEEELRSVEPGEIAVAAAEGTPAGLAEEGEDPDSEGFSLGFLGPSPTQGPPKEPTASRSAPSAGPKRIECILVLREDPRTEALGLTFGWPGTVPEIYTAHRPPELAAEPGQSFPRKLTDRLLDPEAGSWLGELLITHDLQASMRRPPGPAGDLRLEIDRGPLSAVPWELAVFPGPAPGWLGSAPAEGVAYRAMPQAGDTAWVRWLQASLNRLLGAGLAIDGRVGPSTRSAMEYFLGPGAVDSPELGNLAFERLSERLRGAGVGGGQRVLVVEPSLKAQIASQRPEEMPAVDAYRYGSVSLRVQAESEVDPKRLRHLLEELQPEVLHLVASFRLSTTGEVLLHLESSPEPSGKGGEGLSASLLHSFLERTYAGRATPLVVLDPPAPPRESEALRQLLMRNLFAADLLAHGEAWAVLATGLETRAELAGGVRKLLIDGLEDGRSVGGIVREIRLRSLGALDHDPYRPLVHSAGTIGIALFAAHPALRPIAQEP